MKVEVENTKCEYTKLISEVPVGKATLAPDGALRVRVSDTHYLFISPSEVGIYPMDVNVSERGREVDVDIKITVKG